MFSWFDQLRKEQEETPTMVELRTRVHDGKEDNAWSKVDNLLLHHGKVFVPETSLWQQILADVHNFSHEGVHKTLHRLCSNFYVPSMHRLVREYIKGCVTCQRNKTEHLH